MPATFTLYESELTRLAALICAYPRRETGGEFWGFVDRAGAPVVVLATGPGPAARHGPNWFFQDLSALEARARWLYERHGLYQVGNWHSHHALGLRRPSEGDDHTVRKCLPGMGWGSFLMGLGNIESAHHASIGFYTYDTRGGRHETEARVLPGESPHALLRAEIPLEPPAGNPGAGVQFSVRPPGRAWFEEPGIGRRLAAELSALEYLAQRRGARSRVEVRGGRLEVDLAGGAGGAWSVIFQQGFPEHPPGILLDGRLVSFDWDGRRSAAEWILLLSGIRASALHEEREDGNGES